MQSRINQIYSRKKERKKKTMIFERNIFEGRCSLEKERASIDKMIEKVRLHEIKREMYGDPYATNIRIHRRIRLHGKRVKNSRNARTRDRYCIILLSPMYNNIYIYITILFYNSLTVHI